MLLLYFGYQYNWNTVNCLHLIIYVFVIVKDLVTWTVCITQNICYQDAIDLSVCNVRNILSNSEFHLILFNLGNLDCWKWDLCIRLIITNADNYLHQDVVLVASQ